MRARGHCAGGAAMRRIPIGFDEDTFGQIERKAEEREISFAERVRELVELGLETERFQVEIFKRQLTTTKGKNLVQPARLPDR